MIQEILLSIIKYGVLLTILGMFFERLLILLGFVRGKTLVLFFASIIIASVMQIMFLGRMPEESFMLYFLFIVVALPMGANRDDLIGTFTKGRWWWNLHK